MLEGLSAKKRPAIGLLISNISDIYTRQIWPGVADTLRKKDANLIIFSGNPVFSGSSILYRNYGQDFSQQPVNGFDYQSNILYELIDPGTVDALVMTTGSLSYNGGGEEQKKFLHQLRDIPKVSIAIPVEGVPCVLVDNKKGICDSVDHMVLIHGYRRIAFIRGPAIHREAQDRYQAYLESLERHGIPFDEKIVFQGDFMWHSGTEAAKAILESGGPWPEAVIAANDSMAIAVMSYFQTHGVRIPGDIAVSGFDNIEHSQFSFVPLSTVRQPFYQQAGKAAEIALDLAQGLKVPDTTVLSSEFIPRASCGCMPRSIQYGTRASVRPVSPPAEIENRFPALKGVSDYELEVLSSLFIASVTKKETESFFLDAANNITLKSMRAGSDIQELSAALARIRKTALDQFTGKENVQDCERIYRNALVLLAEKSQIVPGMKLIEYMNSETQLVSTMHGIMSKVNIGELLDTIALELPRLNIPGCAIALYEKTWIHGFNDPWNIPEEIELSMSYNPGGRTEPGPRERRYKTSRLLPENFFNDGKCHTLIAQALYFAEEQLGLIFFEMEKTEGMVYELLRLQISNTIKGSLVLRQEQTVQKALQGRIQVMDSELELARKIQSRFIPEKSILQNVSFFYKPMAKVGGDFFDFITFRNPDLTGFFISDVSGHGVPAAFITSMIKTTLLQTASSTNSPAQVLRQMNRILFMQSDNNFITAFYGILNRKKRELEYCYAGHNYPLLITGKGTTVLPTTGKALPLGILDNQMIRELKKDFVDQKIVLEKNSKLFLYTDGLTETVNAAENRKDISRKIPDFESSVLFQAIDRYKHLPSGEFINQMTRQLRNFRGSDEYEDDVCMICVDIT